MPLKWFLPFLTASSMDALLTIKMASSSEALITLKK
jgi:hypothetical protein